jgi:hypothetical protein
LYLQKFLKKFIKIFSRDNIELLIINNFKEIIVIISSLGIIVIILTIIFTGFCKNNLNSSIKKSVSDQIIDNKIEKTNQDTAIQLLSAEDFIIPDIKNFDLSSDYIEFLPNKKYNKPDNIIIEKITDKFINDTVEETYKFNFEKKEISGTNK